MSDFRSTNLSVVYNCGKSFYGNDKENRPD
jgi:hypothetical protein